MFAVGKVCNHTGLFSNRNRDFIPLTIRCYLDSYSVSSTRYFFAINVLVLMVLICFLILPCSSRGATDAEVLIGLNIPLTGPYALQGKDQLKAYKLAQEQINARGGILGRKIRYLYADSKSNPKVSVENVKKFIAQNVDMVTGGSSSGVAIAVSRLCQKEKKLFLATLTYSNDVTGKDAHRYTFRETYNAWMAAKALATYLNEKFSGMRYFYITADYTWGWTTRDSIKKFTKTESAPDKLVPLGSSRPLYGKAIKEALKAGTDVLVLVLFGRDMIYAMQECLEIGCQNQVRQIVVPNLELHMAIGKNPPYTADVIGAVPWYWEIPYLYGFERGKRFVEDYKKRWGKMPGSGGATAYTNIMLYKWAVERTRSFDPKKIIPTLENFSFTLLKDRETIRGYDHQTLQTVYLVRGKSKCKNMWDVFEVLRSFPADFVAPTPEENPVRLEPLE